MQWGQIFFRNSVIHYWREYLRYLYYKNNDILYSVCATVFVQISVTDKILSAVSLFFEVNEAPSSSI